MDVPPLMLQTSDSVLISQAEALGLHDLANDPTIRAQTDGELFDLVASTQPSPSAPPSSPPPPPSSPPPASLPNESIDDEAECEIIGVGAPALPSDMSDDEAGFEILGVKPTLPHPPEKHPYNGSQNFWSLEGYAGGDVDHYIFRILDRTFERPFLAYLVQWVDPEHRFIGSWDFRDDILLPGPTTLESVEWIDVWKDAYPELTYQEYKRQHPPRFTAQDDGDCLFGPIRLGCHLLGNVNLVPAGVIAAFIAKTGRAGVSMKSIREFIARMKASRVGIARDVFKEFKVHESLTSAVRLNNYPLPPDVYVVGAGDACGLRHCFAMAVMRDGTRELNDAFEETHGRVSYTTSPLLANEWIDKVIFVHKLERNSTKRVASNKRGRGQAKQSKA